MCIRDRPNTYGSDDLAALVNYNLKKLNELNPIEGAPKLIDSNWIIAATVRADDESVSYTHIDVYKRQVEEYKE